MIARRQYDLLKKEENNKKCRNLFRSSINQNKIK